MSAEEQELRDYRKRNLDFALKTEVTSPIQLARKLKCDTSYVSQLRNGFRPITFDVAREIEKVETWVRMSLDGKPSAGSVSQFTDDDTVAMVKRIAVEQFKLYDRLPRGEYFDAALKFCTVDARERGFSEGRVRYILEEFLK